MANRTKPRGPNKSQEPFKPYPEFPLFPHATGRWAKTIRQKTHYFGKIVDDPEGTAALERFNREWLYLKDGRTPPPVHTGDGCTLKLLGNAFLTTKTAKLNAGELSRASFADYFRTCRLLVEHFGRDRRVDDLRPDDFERLRTKLAKRWSLVTLRNEINRIRILIKYAFDRRLIDQPVHFGQSFDRPSEKALRRSRNEAGPRLFEAAELQKILDALDGRQVESNHRDRETGEPVRVKRKADPALKAMVLLGANCGFGNTDVASLPQSAVDLQAGWIDFPRPKTEIPRRVPLWPETIEAVRTAIAARPVPKDKANSDLCFVTIQGNRWVRIEEKQDNDQRDSDVKQYVKRDSVASRFNRLLKRLGINGRRRLGFCTLRHVFQTIAGESKDPDAVSSIIGHIDASMAAVDRERISDDRLRAVVDVVRSWLSSAS